MEATLLDVAGVPLRGSYRSVAVKTPAIREDWTYKLPSGYAYRWLLGRWKYNVSAEVATRRHGLQILDGDGAQVYVNTTGKALAAGAACLFGAALGGQPTYETAIAIQSLVIPNVILPAGYSLGSFTPELGPGDEIVEVRLLLEQLWDVAPHEAPGALTSNDRHWSDWTVAHAT